MINYDLASKTYDQTRNHSDALITKFVDRVPLTVASAILDFGCGTGNYLDSIQRSFGCRCCGVEPSDGMRAIAAEKNNALDVRKGDHREIPFDAETFDFAFMTDVIHHVPELDLMFSEIWRVLKTGGFLCVVTESHEQIQARFYNRYFPSLAANEKQRYPKIQTVVNTAVKCGFSHEDTEVFSASSRKSITEQFLTNVEEKNYSMFRLLDELEYVDGLSQLKADKGKSFETIGGGESLIWLRR